MTSTLFTINPTVWDITGQVSLVHSLENVCIWKVFQIENKNISMNELSCLHRRPTINNRNEEWFWRQVDQVDDGIRGNHRDFNRTWRDVCRECPWFSFKLMAHWIVLLHQPPRVASILTHSGPRQNCASLKLLALMIVHHQTTFLGFIHFDYCNKYSQETILPF